MDTSKYLYSVMVKQSLQSTREFTTSRITTIAQSILPDDNLLRVVPKILLRLAMAGLNRFHSICRGNRQLFTIQHTNPFVCLTDKSIKSKVPAVSLLPKHIIFEYKKLYTS
jgi:hypothetical protein